MIPLPEDDLRAQRRRIRRAMRYGAPPERMAEAEELLQRFRDDRFGLAVLLEFYSFLPEAREDWVREIRTMARRQGIFLLLAVTGQAAYMYLVSGEGLEFEGRLGDGYLDPQLVEYFGLAGEELGPDVDPDRFPSYRPVQVDQDLCPACLAATGELHELGCPVEVCPWCGGQLIGCSCRHDRLGVEVLESGDLDRLATLLEEKGRIAYAPEQRPGFADEGPGVVVE